MRKRASGILMHISSLPGKYGIGDFGKCAYDFVDFLIKSKQKYWQILPIGITGYGDSPYQSFSAFAGNPYFIDLEEFVQKGYLDKSDFDSIDLGNDNKKIEYDKLYFNKMKIIKKAYNNAKKEIYDELEEFYRNEIDWLEEFALYMSIKSHHDNNSWTEWASEYKLVNNPAVKEFARKNNDEIYFWIFTQYFFTIQWSKLKRYANENDIKIIGDLPIYVSEDSSDVWAHPKLFRLDKNLKPVTVAGCPPDAFSDTGQLWGNPIYDWDYMDKHGYKWWIKRIKFSLEIFDVIRIDHFRGFESYWEIPYGDETAIDGKWVKGPGMKLFDAIKDEMGDVDIIAEDLGYMTDDVIKLRNDSEYPGMKVLQFAFDSREESDYLPHNYINNSVAYTGTHDNDTAMGWLKTANEKDVEFAKKYLKLTEEEGLNWGFIRGVWASTSYLSVAQMQDFLGFDSSSRMNIPSTLGNNWSWRCEKKDLSDELARKIADLTELYCR